MVVEQVVTKTCAGCKLSLSSDYFYRSGNGLTDLCKDCLSKNVKIIEEKPPKTRMKKRPVGRPRKDVPGWDRLQKQLKTYNRLSRISKGDPVAIERKLWQQYKRGSCPYCGRNFDDDKRKACVDHINPIQPKKGQEIFEGDHTEDNLSLCCADCNHHKRNMHLAEFITRRVIRREPVAKNLLKNGFPNYEKIPGAAHWLEYQARRAAHKKNIAQQV